jgi:Putative multicopper oxidases
MKKLRNFVFIFISSICWVIILHCTDFSPCLTLKIEGTLQTIILNFEKMAGQFLLMDNVDLEAVYTVHNMTVWKADCVSLICSMLYLLKHNPQSRRRRSQLPKTRFSVKWGSRYRFRIINAASVDCPVQFHIERHNMTIIASDGAPVKSTVTSHLLLFPGIICFVIITVSIIRCTTWHNKSSDKVMTVQ